MTDPYIIEFNSKPSRIRNVLYAASVYLKENGIIRPRRDLERLLQKVLKLDRNGLYLASERELTKEEIECFCRLLLQLIEGAPVQYLAGWAPFWGREFSVAPGVFIPRFDTELIIELLLQDFSSQTQIKSELKALDICCGSGALGLTIATELPSSRVILADVSPTAIEYTKRNAVKLDVRDRIEVVEWDALTDPPPEWREAFDIVVCNPPYIRVEQIPSLNPDVQQEPHTALSDGGDGLSFYRKLRETLPIILKRGGWFAFEVGDDMGQDVLDVFQSSTLVGKMFDDLSANPRVFKGVVRT